MNYAWDNIDYSLSASNDPSEAYSLFYNVYKDFFDTCFPKVTKKLSYRMTPRKEWMTKGLIVSCNKRSKLYKKISFTSHHSQ